MQMASFLFKSNYETCSAYFYKKYLTKLYYCIIVLLR